MPRGDRTGPQGMGPMTGRGAGFCTGNNAPGYMNPGPGMGMRRGGGRGMGMGGGGARGGWGNRNWFRATGLTGWMRAGMGAPWGMGGVAEPTPEQEVEMLRAQASELESALGQINQRLDEIQGEQKK